MIDGNIAIQSQRSTGSPLVFHTIPSHRSATDYRQFNSVGHHLMIIECQVGQQPLYYRLLQNRRDSTVRKIAAGPCGLFCRLPSHSASREHHATSQLRHASLPMIIYADEGNGEAVVDGQIFTTTRHENFRAFYRASLFPVFLIPCGDLCFHQRSSSAR